MAYQNRTPAIKITIGIAMFNSLLETLNTESALIQEDEKVINMATKLKEKLLKYSVPRKFEDGIVMVDIRFFPNEASFLLERLITSNVLTDISVDYYSVLLKIRESRKVKEEN